MEHFIIISYKSYIITIYAYLEPFPKNLHSFTNWLYVLSCKKGITLIRQAERRKQTLLSTVSGLSSRPEVSDAALFTGFVTYSWC